MLSSLRNRNITEFLRINRNISIACPHRSDELVVHRDSKENNPTTTFEFTEANMTRLKAIIQNYPEGAQRSALSFAMDLVQRQVGWIPISAMHKVAKILKIPRMRVYEWATFYTMNKRRNRGKYHVQVCVTTPCMLRGSDCILKAVEDMTGCKLGGISSDCMFGVDTVQCQGACVNAPVVVINDDYYVSGAEPHEARREHYKLCNYEFELYFAPLKLILKQKLHRENCYDINNEDVTECDMENIIKTLKSGGIPPCGPQNGRFAAEPITGQTTLLIDPPKPGFGLQKALRDDYCKNPCGDEKK